MLTPREEKALRTGKASASCAPSTLLAGRLGMAIRVVRLSRGMTLQDVTNKCGITKGLISRIENGGDNVEIRTLCKVAAALETTVGRLIEAAS